MIKSNKKHITKYNNNTLRTQAYSLIEFVRLHGRVQFLARVRLHSRVQFLARVRLPSRVQFLARVRLPRLFPRLYLLRVQFG